MSGLVADNIFKASGVIAATAGGLNWVSTVVTASTLTAEAGNGYWINTTSNTCTITLPSAAEVGDQIVFVDYARTWGTNKIIIDSNGLNYQGQDDTYVVEYSTNGEVVNIVYSDGTKGWIPQDDDEVADAPVAPPTQRAIFGYGTGRTNITNLVASNGVVGTNVTGVGTERQSLAAASYGGDKAIFGYGAAQSSNVSVTNLVNNNGVVASDTTGVGSARSTLQAVSYGLDKAMFSYGAIPGVGADYDGKTNLVTNQGVVGSDISQVGTERGYLASTGYGSTGQAIFAFGNLNSGGRTAISNLVNNQGVIQADTSAVGTARAYVSGATYGGDKAIFCFGQNASEANMNTRSLVNNLGVIAADATGAGTARYEGEASNYGGDKAIYAYGAGFTNISNLINNQGVVGSDVTGVGTARAYLAAASYSFSA